MSNLEANQAAVAGVKRKVTQTAINTSINNAKMAKVMNDFVQDSSSAQIWKIPEGDDFIKVKTREAYAKSTELSNNEIVFHVLGGEKYILLDTIQFKFQVVVEKKDGNKWIKVPNGDKLVVKPNAVTDILNRNLECSLIHPGEIVDSKIINIKQDKTTHISPFDTQRKFDRLYVEKELEDDMHVCKEWTYDHAFTNDANTHDDYKPGNADSIFRPRAVDKKIAFAKGSLLEKCKKFGDELKAGKNYTIHGSVMNPIFKTHILPSRHGFYVKMTLGRDEDHMEFFEDYTTLANGTAPSVYRFRLVTTGANKVLARYQVATLTTSAFEKYNQMFAGGKAVEVAQFMVYNHSHRTIEANSTEIQNLELPNTSNLPIYTGWQIKSRTNYDHKSSRDSWMDNSFVRFVEKMMFQGTEQTNTGFREGTTTIDFNEEIDLDELYKQQKRWFLGREHQSMSDQKPVYGLLNGATSQMFDNQGESKADFKKLDNERHTNPFILEFDQSRGKYGADQKHASVPNLAVKASLKFRAPIPVASEVVITSAYRGKYTQRKNTNGTLDMNFLQVDIASNYL